MSRRAGLIASLRSSRLSQKSRAFESEQRKAGAGSGTNSRVILQPHAGGRLVDLLGQTYIHTFRWLPCVVRCPAARLVPVKSRLWQGYHGDWFTIFPVKKYSLIIMLLPLHAALVSSRLEVDNVSYLEHDHLQAHVMEFRVQLPDDKRQRPKDLESLHPFPSF